MEAAYGCMYIGDEQVEEQQEGGQVRAPEASEKAKPTTP